LEGLQVGAGHAALSLGSEREGRTLGRVGSNDLHGEGTGRHGIGRHGREGSRSPRLPAEPGQPCAPGVLVIERRGILPAFPEGLRDVSDRRPADLELNVVPSWAGTVALIQDDRLGITVMVFVVAPTVAQIDPPDEGNIIVRVCEVLEQDELLMVAPSSADPLVHQDFPACFIHQLPEFLVLLLTELPLIGMGAPHEPADRDASTCEAPEKCRQPGPGTSEPLAGIAPPIGEVHAVAWTQFGEARMQPGEVPRAMNERLDAVSLRPGKAIDVSPIDPGGRIAPLLGQQEPVGNVFIVVDGGGPGLLPGLLP
jgi:hypothetical protein